ncbi:amidohydrolase family protein [Roseomonas genomospecies 6]|uniref:Amidohydrolase n=1 Tax=Roseomonas genomospecies 6 TaxID=214106 RepID=A0A9W7KNN2_9PROT|nr:amidohydrolase family protein [Roseomonas genomospecies 6]KAA0676237.1 amidohydrolase [Roseomonas genomospecies 6]
MSALLLVPAAVLASAEAEALPGPAVLVEGGRIAAVAPPSQLEGRGAERIDLPDALLMPGLVNAHQHGRGLSQVQLGYPDDRLELWINRRRGRGAPDPYPLALLCALEMLRNGVTTALHANMSYGSGDYAGEVRAALRGYDEAGLRVTYCVGAADRGGIAYDLEEAFLATLPDDLRAWITAPRPPAYAEGAAGTKALMADLRADFAGHPRVRFAYGPAGPQWVSDGLFKALAEDADRLGLPVHLHALESPVQAAACRRLYPEGVLARLDALGVLGPRTSLAHGVHLTDADMELAAARGVSVVTNPGSNLRLANGAPPLARLRAYGVRLAVGTDNSASQDGEDMLGELRLAGLLARDPQWGGPAGPGPADLLSMATVNGAAVAGWDDVGRLEPGWRADLVALSLERVRGGWLDPDMPLRDAVVARALGRDVVLTMVDGRILYRDGAFPHLDPAMVREAAAEAARRARDPRDDGDRERAVRIGASLDRFWSARLTP